MDAGSTGTALQGELPPARRGCAARAASDPRGNRSSGLSHAPAGASVRGTRTASAGFSREGRKGWASASLCSAGLQHAQQWHPSPEREGLIAGVGAGGMLLFETPTKDRAALGTGAADMFCLQRTG